MTNNFLLISFIFGLLSLIGFYISFLYGKKKQNFSFITYTIFLIIPTVCSLSLTYLFGTKIILLFIESSIIGFILEYILGFAYNKTFKQKLWAYSIYPLSEYTSWLTLPMWGTAGIVFFLISKNIGL